MRVRRRLIGAALVLVLIVPTGLLAYGPLVPWSPVHPGYDQLTLSRARILYPSGTTVPDAYRHVDQWIAEAEAFLEIRIHSRITIVVCEQWGDFHRFVPWIRGTSVAGVTLAMGDVVYITPKVAEKQLDPGEFVRHELAHAVLSQNASLRHAYSAPRRHPWLHEGLSVWFGRQRAFVTQEEFVERAPELGVAAAIVPGDGYGGRDLRFGYVAWRNFLDYLDQTFGHRVFIGFVHAANDDPDRIDALFRSAFGRSLEDEAAVFEQAVRMGRFTPREN
jgi:hypothetical protein